MMSAAGIEQLISNGSASPIIITDGSQRIVLLNAAAEKMLGRSSREVEGKSCFDWLCGQDPFGNRFCHEHCIVGRMARCGEPIRYFELNIQGVGKKRLATGVNVITLRDPDTDELLIVHILQALPDGSVIGASAQGNGGNGTHEGYVAAEARHNGNGNGNGNGKAPALTPREGEVLQFLTNGMSCQEIATCLCISLLTCRNHIRNILRKLDAHSQLEAVAIAHRVGLA